MSNCDARGVGDMAARIDALLMFVPAMESRFAGQWEGGERRPDGSITAPWFNYHEQILAFIRACGENGWIYVFDWQAWLPEASRYYEDPGLLAHVDVETIRKLLTLHIRRDRFVEGHLANMVESGHVAAILGRLREIRQSAQ